VHNCFFGYVMIRINYMLSSLQNQRYSWEECIKFILDTFLICHWRDWRKLCYVIFNKQYLIEHNSETDVTMIIIIIQFMERYFTYFKRKGIVCEYVCKFDTAKTILPILPFEYI